MSAERFTLSQAGQKIRDEFEEIVREGLEGFPETTIGWVLADLARRYPWEPPEDVIVMVPNELHGYAIDLLSATQSRQSKLTGAVIGAMVKLELELYAALHRTPANDLGGA